MRYWREIAMGVLVIILIVVAFSGVGIVRDLWDTRATLSLLERSQIEQLKLTEDALTILKGEFNVVVRERDSLKDGLASSLGDLEIMTERYETLSKQLEWSEHNPTYEEMQSFLNDINSSRPSDVNNIADEEGIRCALVWVNFDWGDYMIVAFETADRGMIFIDPQIEREVELVVGEMYPYSIPNAPHGGVSGRTIIDYEVIW